MLPHVGNLPRGVRMVVTKAALTAPVMFTAIVALYWRTDFADGYYRRTIT